MQNRSRYQNCTQSTPSNDSRSQSRMQFIKGRVKVYFNSRPYRRFPFSFLTLSGYFPYLFNLQFFYVTKYRSGNRPTCFTNFFVHLLVSIWLRAS
ncbi:hypothetical protein ES332_D13G144500v1 [Gossypium tomentosum]|uniref:Transmembrane protein n=1 Tax=Gossypium tomentosum TaxID=34277 RepID=A0A5D2HWZ0_GOSTO|nr:hypothetical protein ES332_D13G144500v1 [Gossypium tomentosum]